MTIVKKGGREFTVEEEDVACYLAEGYDVIDAKGNTLRVGNAVTFDGLMRENESLRQTVGRLTNSNAILEAEKAALIESLDKATKDADAAKSALGKAQKRVEELEKEAKKKTGDKDAK